VKIFVTVWVTIINLHDILEAICEGVTAVKVLRGIKAGKRLYLMTAILKRKALGIN